MHNKFLKDAARYVLIHVFILLVFMTLGMFLEMIFFKLNGLLLGVAFWVLFALVYLLMTDEIKERFWDSITGGR